MLLTLSKYCGTVWPRRMKPQRRVEESGQGTPVQTKPAVKGGDSGGEKQRDNSQTILCWRWKVWLLTTTALNRGSGFSGALNLLSLRTEGDSSSKTLWAYRFKALQRTAGFSSGSGHINPDHFQQVYFTKSLPVGKIVFFKPQNISSSVCFSDSVLALLYIV